MSKSLFRNVLMTILVCLAVVQAIYYRTQLPAQVASHFDAAGRPNGWMSRDGLLYLNMGIVLVISILFSTLAFAVRSMSSWGKTAAKNLTDEAEAAERKRAGERMAESTSSMLFWFGVATILLVLALGQMAIRANLGPNPSLDHAGTLMIAYLGVLALLTARVGVVYWRYSARWPREPLPTGVWFPAKRFGWGWGPPACWQGWVFMGIWIGVLTLGVIVIAHTSLPWLVLPFAYILVIVLLIVCAKKGEKPRWRWGK